MPTLLTFIPSLFPPMVSRAGRMSFTSSHSESRSVKISAHRSKVLSRPSGDSVSMAIVHVGQELATTAERRVKELEAKLERMRTELESHRIVAYKASRGFESSLEKMRRVNYEFDVSNAGRDHQGIIVVWVFALGFKGESRIASGSGPLMNFLAYIGLPCRGANTTRSRATHYDIDVSFHQSLRTEGWLARLPYVWVEVAAMDKVLDLVLQIVAFLSIVLIVAVEVTITSVVSVFDSRP
ncbi:hypothetical protein BHM03_00018850 [Ensete ventricosum]|nr:hypothetical protein BHM03_00018850 [Ensete ventricosum]